MDFASYDELAQLVIKAQAGQPEAFTSLHKMTSPALRRAIANKTGFAEAEDILQETYLTAWRNLQNIEPQSVVAYLNAVARNLCSNHLRQKSRRYGPVEVNADAVPYQFHQGEEPPHSANPADLLEARDMSERLREALDRELDDQERNALLSRYALGMKNEDVAAQLDVSERTVKRIIARALATLRHKLSFALLGSDLAASLSAAGTASSSSALEISASARISPHRHHIDIWHHIHQGAALAAIGATLAIGLVALNVPVPESIVPDEAPLAQQDLGPATSPVCEKIWIEDGVTCIRIAEDAAPLARAWCTNAEGAEAFPVETTREPNGRILYRFNLASGPYTLHTEDIRGTETTGTLQVTRYLDPEPAH